MYKCIYYNNIIMLSTGMHVNYKNHSFRSPQFKREVELAADEHKRLLGVQKGLRRGTIVQYINALLNVFCNSLYSYGKATKRGVVTPL